jgi:hypothetical protein
MKLNRRDAAGAAAAALAASILGVAKGNAMATCNDAGLSGAVEAFRVAMLNADGKALADLSHDALSFGHSNGVVQSKEEFISTVVNQKEIFNKIRQTDHHNVVVNDFGIARHIFDADITFEGKPLLVKLGMLQVWKQEGGAWKMLARQAYRLPDA